MKHRRHGFTLVELLVVMPFLLIVTTIVGSTVVTAYGAESSVQATAQSSSQVTLAFLALDSEVRYASDIQVGQDSSSPPNYYVEFDSDWNTDTQGEPECSQLEYNNSTGTLDQKTWYSDGTIPSGWQVLASGLETSITADPFSLGDSGSPWTLTISISSVISSGSEAGTAQSSFTLTALNTSSSSSNSGVCGGTP